MEPKLNASVVAELLGYGCGFEPVEEKRSLVLGGGELGSLNGFE